MNIKNYKYSQIIILSLLFVFIAGCEKTSTKQSIQKSPNILFVLADDQSWLHTGIAGNKIIKTPAFDRIAKEGVLFENAFSACPWPETTRPPEQCSTAPAERDRGPEESTGRF